MLQVGISNNINERLHAHSKLGWQVRDVVGPIDGLLVENWEREILRFLKLHGATFAPTNIAGRFDGYTECWMEESFPVLALKDLMESIRATQ
jgi:hypothetical protein